MLCSFGGLVVGLDGEFPSCLGVVIFVDLCGSFWWLVTGVCFQVSRVF